MTNTPSSSATKSSSSATRPRRRQPRWTLIYATSLITQLRASGLSLHRFATQLQIDPKRLSYWHQRVLRAGTLQEHAPTQNLPVPAFIPIVQQAPSAPQHTFDLLFHGLTLRFREAIDPDTLLPLINALAKHS